MIPTENRCTAWNYALVIGVVLLASCKGALPVAPSDFAEGIVVYEHANYLGRSGHVTQDLKDLKDFFGPCEETTYNSNGTARTVTHWNDCISSIRLAPGWKATLYRDDDFKGDRLEVAADLANLQLAAGDCDKGGFNDCATSVRLFKP